MNTIVVAGNLGKPIELRYTQNGKAKVQLSVAETRAKGDEKETVWHNVVCFDKLAEHVSASAQKGQRLVVVGRLSKREYTANDGTKKDWVEIVAEDIAISLRWSSLSGETMGSSHVSEPEDPF